MKKSLNGISDLSACLKKNLLFISYNRARNSCLDRSEIDISDVPVNTKQTTNVRVRSNYFKNKVLLVKKIQGTDETLVVYTDDKKVVYYKHNDKTTHPLTRLIIVKSKAFWISLTKCGLRLIYACAINNKYDIPIKSCNLTIGEDVKIKKNYPVYKNLPSKLRILLRGTFSDYVSMRQLLGDNPTINESMYVSLDIDGDGQIAHHSLSKGSKFIKDSRWYYAPIAQTRVGDYSVSLRRSRWGGLSLVRRKLELIEKTRSFKFFESKVVSFLFYHIAHVVRRISKKVVNIYFEKNANQAEEGAIDIFRKARDNSGTKNYFIIKKTADIYDSIREEVGVVENFTFKSYWLMYRANNVISTEAPQHVNILRSSNKYARRAPYSQKFVFLQHGVTYMKAQDKSSSFIKGRECEPDYIVVGGLKERDAVVDMLGIEEERVLSTGLPIFDKINYNQITDKSQDIVTIMLTWRPYEEHLEDFSLSTYYRMVLDTYEMLKPIIGKEKIQIVAHPKFVKLLCSTDIADSVWTGPVSEALEQTKLLITDYSSVCYNVFYQGGAVVFYQPDLDIFQENVGMLVPSDEEYIGYRAFNRDDLAKIINDVIVDSKIRLRISRSQKYIKNYQYINQYNDGKNIDRLYSELKKLSIL